MSPLLVTLAPRWASLWLTPLALAVAAALVALFAGTAARARLTALAGLAVSALPLGVSAASALRGGLVLDGSPLRLVRIGSLDAVLALALDARGLALGVAALIATLVFALRRADAPRDVALALFAAAGAVLCALGDGVPALWIGLTLCAIPAWGLSGATPAKAAARSWTLLFAGLALWMAALGVVFWALGGQWLDDARYLSDYRPRFAVVGQVAKPGLTSRDPRAVGHLNVLSHPGSRVYAGVADETQLVRSEPLGVTPLLRAELPAGLHKITIVPGDGALIGGDGLEAALVDAVALTPEKDTSIELVGPTLTFREIERQARDAAFPARRLGTVRVGDALSWLLALAGLLTAAAFAADRPRERPLSAFLLVALAALAVRVGQCAGAAVTGDTALIVAGVLLAVIAAAARSPGAPIAAGLGLAALVADGRPGVALVAGLAPAWALLSTLGAAADGERARGAAPAEAAAEVPRASKKKAGKKRAEKLDAPVPAATATRALPWWAFWGPLVLGPLLGFGGLAVSGYGRSVLAGLTISVAVTVIWAALAVAVARGSAAAAAALEAERGLLLLLALIATSAASLLVVRPWDIDAHMGLRLAPLVAGLALAPGFVLYGRARGWREGERGSDAGEEARGPSGALSVLRALAGAPWALIETLAERIAGGRPGKEGT